VVVRIGRTAVLIGLTAAEGLVHCHVLEHDDNGMMAVVEVVP